MYRILHLLLLAAFCPSLSAGTPNVVLVYFDDLGYADVGCFGAKGIKTTHIDRIAKKGVRCTNFLVAQPVCSASRAALLTGCYPNRLGIHGALGPKATHGIADSEVTLGELFQSRGYATAAIGKWHLGHLPPFLPNKHGFDVSYGLPYSNDMWPHHPTQKDFPKLPLLKNGQILDDDVTAEDQAKLTGDYTQEAVQFIENNATKPFFLYLAHTMPHVPLYNAKAFTGTAEYGPYGDVVQELDWSVGQVLATLEKHKLTDNTLVIVTSDNGPWLSYGNHAGLATPLREGKGSVWEGGIRVPFVAQWPGHIPAGTVRKQTFMTIDLLPTLAKLIDAKLPDHTIDGRDAWPILRGDDNAVSPQVAYWLYYGNNELQGIRAGDWKLILPHSCRMIEDRKPGQDGKPAGYKQVKLSEPQLFNLLTDPGEQTDLAKQEPKLLAILQNYAEQARVELGDSLTKRQGSGNRKPGQANK